MELLIELIVWMFKAFFGDPEKTVDTTKLNRKPPLRPAQRGPYKYGDESPGNAPKTLEEILEEARRQAAERRGELVRPPQPAQPPAVRRVVPDAPVQTAPPPVRTIVATPLEEDEPREFLPRVPQPPPPPAAPPQKQRQRRQPAMPVLQPEATPNIPAPAIEAPKPARAASKKKVQQPQIYAVPDLLQAIRTAPPADKRDAARQAMVVYEIFGPPRARRGFQRPGARAF